ncbi:Os02g0526202 [Oryza sativa Japonica Group]|uniref:Os02g0526202 protein n=1 Tax=Oryza sativa subsp. japonica TaxID=39947 RepID=A0A0P0VJR8_ORYSJ|nr:Os02g0526202 [Oryza sativa Japonica Group]
MKVKAKAQLKVQRLGRDGNRVQGSANVPSRTSIHHFLLLEAFAHSARLFDLESSTQATAADKYPKLEQEPRECNGKMDRIRCILDQIKLVVLDCMCDRLLDLMSMDSKFRESDCT